MLCLNSKEMSRIVSYHEVLDKVEQAFKIQQKGDFYMPDRMHAVYKGNTLLLMPCFTGAAFGTKLVSLFPENIKKGLPRLYGTMMLNDAETGEPLALMNGAVLTALRTGAAGGVGVRYTTPADTSVLGVVGAGIQGLYQAIYTSLVRPIKKVLVFDKNKENVEKFRRGYSDRFKEITIKTSESADELVKASEVIITATNSKEPVLPNEQYLLKGKHFIGIGSYKPDMREFPEALFRLTKRIFIDTEQAKEESGDLVIPIKKGWIKEDQVIPLGRLVTKEENINVKKQTTLFKSVGMALFDLVTADYIYQKAKVEKMGIEVDL